MSRGRVISFLQMKGGAGKSTLCANIGAALSQDSKVLLLDTDHPQSSLAGWFEVRSEHYSSDENLQLAEAKTLAQLQKQIRDNLSDFDYILVDGHPRITNLTRAALMLSDLAVIPLSPSPVEVWATREMASAVEQAQQVNNNLLARICWNRYRSRTGSADEVIKQARRELKIPDLKTRLGFRVAYLDSFSEGRTVAEWYDPAARMEIWSVTSAITRLLAKHAPGRLKTEAAVKKFAQG